MRTIHDPFTQQMSDRLQTAVMGLGLVRLLQDAGRTEEARATLYELENGFQADAADTFTRGASCLSEPASIRISDSELRPHPMSIV